MESSEPIRIALAGATGLIGSQVVRYAREAGHEVVGSSRSTGVDLTDPEAIGERLSGVDVLIDVTRSPSMETEDVVASFTTVVENLGRAAQAAGVGRSLVLSVVGIEESQDFGWYVATLAHERATRAHAPGTRVLRATQFHEYPGQTLARSRRGGRARIVDWPTQTVDSAEVARQLVEMASEADGSETIELAGPRRERVVNLPGRRRRGRGPARAGEHDGRLGAAGAGRACRASGFLAGLLCQS